VILYKDVRSMVCDLKAVLEAFSQRGDRTLKALHTTPIAVNEMIILLTNRSSAKEYMFFREHYLGIPSIVTQLQCDFASTVVVEAKRFSVRTPS
jgi:hypothetical protein